MKSHSRYVQTLDFSRRVVAHNFALPHLQSLPLGRCAPSSMLLGVRLAILIPAIVNFWFANAECYLCDGAGILYPYNTVLLTDAVTGETIVYSCSALAPFVPFPIEDCYSFKSFAEPICGCPYQASPIAYQPPFASPSPPSPVKIPPYPTQSIDDDATPSTSPWAIIGIICGSIFAAIGGSYGAYHYFCLSNNTFCKECCHCCNNDSENQPANP